MTTTTKTRYGARSSRTQFTYTRDGASVEVVLVSHHTATQIEVYRLENGLEVYAGQLSQQSEAFRDACHGTINAHVMALY